MRHKKINKYILLWIPLRMDSSGEFLKNSSLFPITSEESINKGGNKSIMKYTYSFSCFTMIYIYIYICVCVCVCVLYSGSYHVTSGIAEVYNDAVFLRKGEAER